MQDFLIDSDMLISHKSVFDQKQVNYESISDIVHESHKECCHDQSKKLGVVFAAYTIIYPSTVVVKFTHTSIAGTTVLC
jgi:hypothetical protein